MSAGGVEPVMFQYDPEPDHLLLEPGATPAYLYLWSGEPGPALVAKVTAIVDDDGNGFMDVGEFEDCTVVDDRES